MQSLPSSARVVVIGGGIGGCSAAYHLAKLGVTDVLILERSLLSSGTTWHSTGNMETYRPDPLIFDMVRYAATAFPKIAAESGQDIGWRTVGRVMYTDREERWELMQTLPELGRARGMDIGVLTPEQVVQRLPILAPEGLVGGVWIPGDARVNPTDAVMAYSKAAKARGVSIHENVQVLSLIASDGCLRGVETSHGTLTCDTVIVAAGLWSGDLLASVGLRLPLYALEHQYLVTKPVNIDRNMPLFLSYDDQLYGREEVGGLMVGSLDDDAIALSTSQLPQNFSFALLNERWEQFEPYMTTALRRFPVLRSAEVRMLLNGPESFTPDGQMLLGPVPGVSGVFAACGFNSNGIALAPAAGRFIAEWIVEGAPSVDVAPLDVRRFSPAQCSEAYMRERVAEIPGYHCKLNSPGRDYQSARHIRRTPLHEQFAAAGAQFASVNAWERPLWISAGSQTWIENVAAEDTAALQAVLVVDRSADVKRLLVGDTVLPWLEQEMGSLANASRSDVILVPLPGGLGQTEALVRVTPWDADAWLLLADPEQETRLDEWLRRKTAGSRARAANVTSAHTMLELHGPGRHALMSQVVVRAAPSGKCAAVGQNWLGAVPVQWREDNTNDSTLLLADSDCAAYVWDRLMAAGKQHGLRLGGHFSQEAIRIRRGIPGFGKEATPGVQANELQRNSRPPQQNVSASAQRASLQGSRVLKAYTSTMSVMGFGAREVVLCGDRSVGELTSRARLPHWPLALAMARVEFGFHADENLVVVSNGRRWPLVTRTTCWSEAQDAGARLRDRASHGV